MTASLLIEAEICIGLVYLLDIVFYIEYDYSLFQLELLAR